MGVFGKFYFKASPLLPWKMIFFKCFVMQQAKEAGIQTLVMIDEQGGKQKSLLLLAVLFVRHLICISCFCHIHSLSAF